MFNIGFAELIILAIIGIIVIGPEQLPEMARKLAKILNELKRAKDEIMSPVEDFKNEAFRAVDKVREEAEKMRSQVNTELHNQVNAVMNQMKPKEPSPDTVHTQTNVEASTDKKLSADTTDHLPKKDEGHGS